MPAALIESHRWRHSLYSVHEVAPSYVDGTHHQATTFNLHQGLLGQTVCMGTNSNAIAGPLLNGTIGVSYASNVGHTPARFGRGDDLHDILH